MRSNKYMIFLFIGLLAMLLLPGGLSAEELIYGHVSYVEGSPRVIRMDQNLHAAVVNLPIAPGDIIVTDEKSRCEFQFDNGTVMRLDRDSVLKVVTVLANSLTSKWKMTTLQLSKGQLYSLNKSYDLERFQILTPNAAINLKSNAVATITLRANGETHVFADAGSFRIMYGGDKDSLKTDKVSTGNGFAVTTDDNLRADGDREVDFVAWNQYIDRNFVKLHDGINKLPKKLYRYSKGIVHWAEKWSTMHGEWVWDDLFGYVWKPGDERFAYFNRPFFHAKYVWVNNRMFVVPTEPWGWVPANLGTWVWTKTGWSWIPGNAYNDCRAYALFPNAAEYSMPYYWNTVYTWIYHYYGHTMFPGGTDTAAYRSYKASHDKTAAKERLQEAPENIRRILKNLDKASPDLLKAHMANLHPELKKQVLRKASDQFTAMFHPGTAGENTNKADRKPVVNRGGATNADGMKHTVVLDKSNPAKTNPVVTKKEVVKQAVINKDHPAPVTNVTPPAPNQRMKHTVMPQAENGTGVGNGNSNIHYYRDWNPDKRWAQKRGVAIGYSSKTNEVICPSLRLRSSTISRAQQVSLRRSNPETLRSVAITGTPDNNGTSSSSNTRSNYASKTSQAKQAASRAEAIRETSSKRAAETKKTK